MALATADADGMPDARMVMLRSFGGDGFVFFTDRESAKGAQLRANPRAVLLGYWRELGRQVRVSGRVEETSPTEDDEAFRERPPRRAARHRGMAPGNANRLTRGRSSIPSSC